MKRSRALAVVLIVAMVIALCQTLVPYIPIIIGLFK